jgi:subtilisin family serine protease
MPSSRWRRVSLGVSMAAAAWCGAAASAEPRPAAAGYHYHYFDEPRPLELDPTRVAVLVAGEGDRAALRLQPGHLAELEAVGLDTAALETWAVAGWTLVGVPEDERTGPGVERIVGELSRRVVGRGGASFAFVSPVFVDDLGGPMFVTPRLLVRFAEGVDEAGADAALADAGAGAILETGFGAVPNSLRVAAPDRSGLRALDVANTLAARPDVLYAEPDMVFTGRGLLVPNDPGFINCWGLRNVGQFGGAVFDFDMDADEAWDVEQGDGDIITLIIDTGVDSSHPDLNLRTPGIDTTSDFGTGDPINSFDNHGTPVAGCVSAHINNGIGTIGVAPGTRSVSARTFISINPSGNWTSASSWTVSSLIFGQSIGCRVSNNSNAYGFTSASIETTYDSTRNAGMVHFASAGNNASSNASYPATLATVNSIAALDFTGALASFSNFGTSLAFSAPGESVYSTDRTGPSGYSGGSYTFVRGTSFAAPYAAGVAALVLSRNPGLTPLEVENILATTSVDLGAPSYDTTFGWGHVNAAAALAATPAPTVPPGPFDLLAPAPGTSGLDPRVPTVLAWSAASDADDYTVTVLDGSVPIFQTTTASMTATVPESAFAFGGAYGWSVEASNGDGETDGTPASATFGMKRSICRGDLDNDGSTTVFDFALMASSFGDGPGATFQQGDISGDGFVDVFDFATLSTDFGCVTP